MNLKHSEMERREPRQEEHNGETTLFQLENNKETYSK